MLPRERIFVAQGVSRRKAAKSCLRARPKCTQKAYGRGAALSDISRGGWKDWSEREEGWRGGGRRERCKERDNNKWLARRRMLDLHEKIDGPEEGDACSVCSWPVRAALTPHPPFELFIFAGQNLSQCLSMRFGENISRYDAKAFSTRKKLNSQK